MKKMLKAMAAVALFFTAANMNAGCTIWIYQPEIPECAKKLNKCV